MCRHSNEIVAQLKNGRRLCQMDVAWRVLSSVELSNYFWKNWSLRYAINIIKIIWYINRKKCGSKGFVKSDKHFVNIKSNELWFILEFQGLVAVSEKEVTPQVDHLWREPYCLSFMILLIFRYFKPFELMIIPINLLLKQL